MKNIRALNSKGIEVFNDYIFRRRSKENVQPPYYALFDAEYSEEINVSIDIEEIEFSSRYEIGTYLTDKFNLINIQPYLGHKGFWSWLALFWFDQLAPKKDSQHAPAKEYNYILSSNYNHRPRHAIFMTWQLVNQYGEDVRFMLSKAPSVRGELTEQLMARQEILSSNSAIGVASLLYYDTNTGSFKRGATGRKSAGCVARFVSWLQQVQRTYDIFSMSKEELSYLLPNEFEKFQN